MRWAFVFALIFSAFGAFAQGLDFVKAEVRTLTDSSFHGRGYVNDGSNIAATYIAERFEEIGLNAIDGTYFQPFTFAVNVFETPTNFSVHGVSLKAGYDYIADSRSGTTQGKYITVSLDSTHFQEGLPLPKTGLKVPVVNMKGMNSPEEMTALHNLKLALLGNRPMVLVQPDKLTWSVGRQELPHAVIEVLKSSMPSKHKKIIIDVTAVERQFEAVNVVGMIPGRRIDSAVVITAHYDHLGRFGEALFPGASDNASGVATMLDMAVHFKNNPPEFDTWFIAFAAEEAGLKGSKYFVDHPLLPLEKIKLLVNLDLMGSAANGITVVNGRHYPELMSELASINTENKYLPKIKLRGKAANSDHYWFSEAGVPAIFIYTEGNVSAYHDVHDVAEGLDWTNYSELFTLLTEFITKL
jgi:putative aminopeptidase FrvX